MVEALQKLGFAVKVELDANEFSNRTITVAGLGGKIPNAGTVDKPLELFVGNAGTAARFLAALVCLGNGMYRLQGVPRMHSRPQAALFAALRELGYQIDASKEKLPAVIHGMGARKGKCRVSIEESSQFASALLLAGNSNWDIEIFGANQEEQPYVDMTRELVKAFPQKGGEFQIEADASSGSYFWGAAWILQNRELAPALERAARNGEPLPPGVGVNADSGEHVSVSVSFWPRSGWQIDADFLNLISASVPHFACRYGGITLVPYRVFLTLPSEVSREHDLGDSIMTAAVLAPLMGQKTKLTDLGRLRVQETERVVALRTELTRCGADVVEEGDTLTITPAADKLHGAEIETYNDHRMAMCFAMLGLKVPGIKIKNPSCVKKTFPDFFQKLAALPSRGLGTTILDGRTGKALSGEELFAE
jgi:3-phosphoshikimate 1-carboxyvinyltransferase